MPNQTLDFASRKRHPAPPAGGREAAGVFSARRESPFERTIPPLRGDRDIIKAIYWELNDDRRSLFDRRNPLRWRHPRWLLHGFLGYVLMRANRRLRSAGRPTTTDSGRAAHGSA